MNTQAPPPQISVLLPVHNEKVCFLVASIESILNQTEKNFELLLLDDASTDAECLDILSTYKHKDTRIRLIHNPKNIGLTKTLNKGLSLARGEYIARQDGDDISDPERFAKQLKFLHTHPNYALCGTWATIINESGKYIGTQRGLLKWKEAQKKLLCINTFVHSSFFFKKSVILSLGGYTEEMKKAQDYDLLLKIAPKFPIGNIPEYLCQYRISATNITFSNNKNQEYYAIRARLKALREYGYPKWYFLKIIRPLFFYYCVPSPIKKFLMHLLWKI